MTCPVCLDSTSSAWLYCWGCKLPRSERLTYAFQRLVLWMMRNRTHPALKQVEARADRIADALDPQVARIERRYP